ncbi:MAG: hypothetical protein EXR63_02895 [Dehalococcoidia bacterium]|nr:hypothetical protein [Dehalococcoidia bacterium]
MKAAIAAALGVAIAAILMSTMALVDAGGEGSAEASAHEVEVTLGDLFIRPETLNVPGGSPIVLAVKNTGGVEHDLSLEGGPATPRLRPGAAGELKLGALKAGSYKLLCTVPGHADAGMRATLTVTEGGATAPPTGAATHTMTADKMDESYMAGVKAFPAKTAGAGNQLMTPRMDGNVKVFELTASAFEWEVAQGDTRQAMGYNQQVPGPQIRVRVGDRVRIVLHNRLPESTAIHFHGLVVPNDQDGVPGITQPLVKPGADYTYEFTVRNAGSHMYHSHMNGANQIPAGLLGAFIVEDNVTPNVTQDVLMVVNDGPLGCTLNGKGFPATTPIVAKQGDTIRIRYMNEGLQIHPMHLHGISQRVITQDGFPLPQPYSADTVLIAPGQRLPALQLAGREARVSRSLSPGWPAERLPRRYCVH